MPARALAPGPTACLLQVQLAEAQLYMKASEYEQAVATTGKLLKADERNLAALLLRGNAYFYLYGERQRCAGPACLPACLPAAGFSA